MTAPPVMACTVHDCIHNKDNLCHALNISVGQYHPLCDTYERGITGSKIESSQGAVGKCDVTLCRYNHELECNAPGITVNWHDNHADCKTYVPRTI